MAKAVAVVAVVAVVKSNRRIVISDEQKSAYAARFIGMPV